MDTIKAIEFLMEEPENKSNSRLRMERQFFQNTRVRWKKDAKSMMKHLVLSVDENDVLWSNGLQWLIIIHDHISSYTDMTYTIEYTYSTPRCELTTSRTSTKAPEELMRELRELHTQWEKTSYIVLYEGVVDFNGVYVSPESRLDIVHISDDGEYATSATGFTFSLIDLIDGDVVKL